MNAPVTRRSFLLAAAALVPLAQDTTVARLPGLIGRPRARITDYENDPFIVGIERRLRCTCGCNLDVYTCRTTDFTCTTSPAMHREVIALYEDGKDGAAIIADFVGRHGETILMAPPKEGFNWAGYLLPGTLITVIGGAIAAVLLRRHRLSAAPVPAEGGAPGAADGLTAEERERLEEALREVEA